MKFSSIKLSIERVVLYAEMMVYLWFWYQDVLCACVKQ